MSSLLSAVPNILEIETTRASSSIIASKRMNNGGENKGICLTWKDLWVTVSGSNNESKSILQGLTGYAKPGQVLAIMGPSGSGKSTLLDALAGNQHFFFFCIFVFIIMKINKFNLLKLIVFYFFYF